MKGYKLQGQRLGEERTVQKISEAGKQDGGSGLAHLRKLNPKSAIRKGKEQPMCTAEALK